MREFNWIGRYQDIAKRRISDVKVSIRNFRDAKNAAIRFTLDAFDKVKNGEPSPALRYAVCDDGRIYFNAGNGGIKFRRMTNTVEVVLHGRGPGWQPYVGEYALEYDKDEGLWYIDTNKKL